MEAAAEGASHSKQPRVLPWIDVAVSATGEVKQALPLLQSR
jgi:hypothetical protein